MSDIPPIPQQPNDREEASPIDYAWRGEQRPGRGRSRSILNGLSVGVALSAVIWMVGFAFSSQETIVVMALCAAGLKYLIALVLVFFRDWRSFALGLFASLPVGAVIFFGVCSLSLARM